MPAVSRQWMQTLSRWMPSHERPMTQRKQRTRKTHGREKERHCPDLKLKLREADGFDGAGTGTGTENRKNHDHRAGDCPDGELRHFEAGHPSDRTPRLPWTSSLPVTAPWPPDGNANGIDIVLWFRRLRGGDKLQRQQR